MPLYSIKKQYPLRRNVSKNQQQVALFYSEILRTFTYKSGTLWTEISGILCCEISGIL